MSKPVLIVGVNARAAAMSALKLGYEPWVVDCVGCRDLQQVAHTMKIALRDYPAKLPAMIDKAPKSAAVMMSGDLENYPDIWEAITFGREVIGSGADAVRASRMVGALNAIEPSKGVKLCKIKVDGGLIGKLTSQIFGIFDRRKYLVKPIAGSGGMGVKFWEKGTPIGKKYYLQEYVQGIPVGIAFRADGWSVQYVGACEMISGDRAFGAKDFSYVGSIGEIELSEDARAAVSQIAVAMTQRHDLRGAFNIDFMMDFAGKLWPIEVNPRYSAGMEILEKVSGSSVFDELPSSSKKKGDEQTSLKWGKALIRAKEDCIAPDLFSVLGSQWVANVPDEGVKVAKGMPICSVIADGRTRDEVYDDLKNKAKKIYEAIKTG
ncbi:ATP-grasp domain-containing protein [Planctomycetota bacterium]|nr:ATP-grasp domain-containing protein [Planctomycetota bacterium]